MEENTFWHVSVLWRELIESLDISDSKQNIVVDCTLWLAWHTMGIIERLHPGDILIGFDLDLENLNQARKNIENRFGKELENKNIKVFLLHGSFAHLKEKLRSIGIDSVTAICYDLGVSSAHFDDAKRGFSFRFDGALDMRFDRTGDIPTARDLVNNEKESEIYRILREYGEEPKAKFIAEAIVARRKIQPIETTAELAEIVNKASFDPKSIVRVFQALRIETNNEFGAIETSIRDAIDLLQKGGRCSVITFHSLEDRLVKQIFAKYLQGERDEFTGRDLSPALLKKVTKKPIIPSEEEIQQNPRSRSAKLRIVQKI